MANCASGASLDGVLAAAEQQLCSLASDDPVNSLPIVLRGWLRDDSWVSATRALPAIERRHWLADLGRLAYDRNVGGYAQNLRETTIGLDHVWSREALEAIWRNHVQWLFANLSDVLDFRFAPESIAWDAVAVYGAEHLRGALARGRGAIVLSVHQSHPGFGFLHPSFSDLGVSTVANLGDRNAPHTSMLLDGLRERIEVLPVTSAALRPMLSRLAGGGCVAIYTDYLYDGTPGVLSPLLGGLVLIASAAVSLALRTGAAVVPLAVVRKGAPEGNAVEVRIGSALPFDDLDPRDPQSREALALRFGLVAEALLRRNPEVWRLWPTLVHRWQQGALAYNGGRQSKIWGHADD